MSVQDRAFEGVTVVVRSANDEESLTGLLDALVPQARWCARVVCSGEIGEAAQHALTVEHGEIGRAHV